MNDAWSDPRATMADETQELPLPPKERLSFRPLINTMVSLGVVALSFFALGYWASPNDPPSLDQTRACAGLSDSRGYRVKILAPDRSLVLNVKCVTD